MFNVGDKIRIQTEKELTRRYAEKNKLSFEEAKTKISDFCRHTSSRGLVMKKHEKPFNSLNSCGREGKVLRILSKEGKILYYEVLVKIESQRWNGRNEPTVTILVERNYNIPPSCIMFPDFQMEFDF